MEAIAEFVRRRVAAFPYDYPPSFVIVSDAVLSGAAAGAVAQRHSLVPPGWPLLGGLIAVSPTLWFLVMGTLPRVVGMCIVSAATAIAGTSLLLIQPVEFDLAPFILMMMVGQIAAIAAPRISLPAAAAAVATLLVAAWAGRLGSAPIYVTVVGFGWMVGFMLQTQRRLLQSEREAQAGLAERAASDERRRIAREIHDVIAHSLSITLLHLTGARLALELDEQRDVDDDVVESIRDAERIGRQAMADIRRTVGLLDPEPSQIAPEPGVAEIDDLVADFLRAGLRVKYAADGEPGVVSAATGLGLYRITQESLANVVKHVPGATAQVRLHITADTAELSIRNNIPRGAPSRPAARGRGLVGMRQRAELLGGQLRAGRDPDGWAVRAEVPLTPDGHDRLSAREIQGLG